MTFAVVEPPLLVITTRPTMITATAAAEISSGTKRPESRLWALVPSGSIGGSSGSAGRVLGFVRRAPPLLARASAPICTRGGPEDSLRAVATPEPAATVPAATAPAATAPAASGVAPADAAPEADADAAGAAEAAGAAATSRGVALGVRAEAAATAGSAWVAPAAGDAASVFGSTAGFAAAAAAGAGTAVGAGATCGRPAAAAALAAAAAVTAATAEPGTNRVSSRHHRFWRQRAAPALQAGGIGNQLRRRRQRRGTGAGRCRGQQRRGSSLGHTGRDADLGSCIVGRDRYATYRAAARRKCCGGANRTRAGSGTGRPESRRRHNRCRSPAALGSGLSSRLRAHQLGRHALRGHRSLPEIHRGGHAAWRSHVRARSTAGSGSRRR